MGDAPGSSPRQQFGKYLRELRQAQRLSLRNVAEYMDGAKDTSRLSRAETGKIHASDRILRAYALALNTDYGDLVGHRHSLERAIGPTPAVRSAHHAAYVFERIDLSLILHNRRPIECIQHRTVRATDSQMDRVVIGESKTTDGSASEVQSQHEALYGCEIREALESSDGRLLTMNAHLEPPLKKNEVREFLIVNHISDPQGRLKPVFSFTSPVHVSQVIMRMQFYGHLPEWLRYRTTLTDFEKHAAFAYDPANIEGEALPLREDGYAELRIQNLEPGGAIFAVWNWRD